MPDTALLIIDLQPGLLTGAHDLDACLSRVADLADRARSAGAPVVYLRQRLDEPSDVHPGVAPRDGDVLAERGVRRLAVTFP
jgi:nicotinamidase-related amidase